ncbi:carcinoembryonic antigen-related cell adhesion molecule 5-like [Triplophysa dalaica]|uniref:carcinoembryonic antigen-related cell adhesion molecule 5-like n=1 Tax=Triplophysa dalaica TaxID=1582913 RepID=UPI0024DF31E8|nr:carcinoembryonic antigen-related cell adhesion molecule 5-like [Triplophysa dalaica]
MHTIIFLIIILSSGLCHKRVQRGSDITLQCDVPHISESSTLMWIKETDQTSNTTLLYNNSAYIILHNVDENSEGIYYCILQKDGRTTTIINRTLSVTLYSESKKLIIYRQSSSDSDLLLICKSKKKYHRLMWTFESRPNSKSTLIAVEKGGEVQVKGPIEPGVKTSTTYDSQIFVLHISSVEFQYNGTYKCIVDDQNSSYTATILRTIRVYAEPPGGLLRNQSVVLTCEVSNVSDSVKLVWLRMQGNRTVLVKQQMLNEKKTLLTVIVNSLQSDLLHWQCAVFTDNTLRAVAPVTINLISSATNAPKISTETSALPNQEDTLTQESHIQTLILVACAVTIIVLLFLGLLVFKCWRKTFISGHDTVLNSQKEEEELHYASVTVTGCSQGAESWSKPNARSKVSDNSSTVIYSAIKIQ